MGFLLTKIADSLTKSFEVVNEEIDNVNRGGCGFFAKHIYELLKKKGFNPELVLLVREYAVDDADYYISNNNINDLFNTNWYHVMVRIDGLFIDCKGFFTKIEQHPTFNDLASVDLPYDMLKVMLSSKYSHRWNPSFDRDDSKIIRKIIKKHLDKCK